MEAELTEILNAVKHGDMSVSNAKKEIVGLVRNSQPHISHWEAPSLDKIIFMSDEDTCYFLHTETNEKYSFNQLIQYGHSCNDISKLVHIHFFEKEREEGHITEEEFLLAKSNVLDGGFDF